MNVVFTLELIQYFDKIIIYMIYKMIKIPFKILVDDTKFNEKANLVAFKTITGGVYIYSFIT